MAPDEGRHAELVDALASVRAQIERACAQAGRDAGSVTLIAVTKTYPATDVVALGELGVLDIGESRAQEASAKVADTTALLSAGDRPQPMPRWHFVGRLQSRKARSVAGYAHAVHSLDRIELVSRLADGVRRAGRVPLEVFLQLSLDDDPDRGGVGVRDLAALADCVAEQDELVLLGLMAIAPLGAEPDAAFASLARASQGLRREHPGATAISAGMSADLAAAVRNGSTHVRVGSALLGPRAAAVG
ncbi:MAG: YggS family pyridoxal phosphate-dependent enzyme [Actinomycetota bacterium]|nr:YggS family pyridoxal phosphate-dependent enzyme [Actinomycetota bacterium]